jgi:limonene-1,2-epoxide hydrolase
MKLCHEAVDVADRGWTRKFAQESLDHKNVTAPDDLSVVLGFTQMLSGDGNEDEVARLATDHGWLDPSGQLTAAGDQLARALLQQSGTRTIFRVW